MFLLDTTAEFSYGLDAPGAQIWITIESSPLGNRFEDILVALETHFDYPRKRLVGELSFQLQRLRTLGFVERLRETYWLQKRMAESTFYLGQWTC